MAEDHRRVEPRGIVGTGMTADPERIRDIEAEADRRGRAWRAPPAKGFGDVLQDAPARGALEDEDPDQPKRRPKQAPPAQAMTTAAMEAQPAAAAAVADAAKEAAATAKKALPKVAPDPREAMLRKRLAQAQASPKPAGSFDTPPTGSTRKPT